MTANFSNEFLCCFFPSTAWNIKLALVVLEIMGEVELVQSSVTCRFYATSKKASITSTFSSEIAERLVGKELPGRIQQISFEPYSYMIPETGEEVTLKLNHIN